MTLDEEVTKYIIQLGLILVTLAMTFLPAEHFTLS
jgi:hypothetical protein